MIFRTHKCMNVSVSIFKCIFAFGVTQVYGCKCKYIQVHVCVWGHTSVCAQVGRGARAFLIATLLPCTSGGGVEELYGD